MKILIARNQSVTIQPVLLISIIRSLTRSMRMTTRRTLTPKIEMGRNIWVRSTRRKSEAGSDVTRLNKALKSTDLLYRKRRTIAVQIHKTAILRTGNAGATPQAKSPRLANQRNHPAKDASSRYSPPSGTPKRHKSQRATTTSTTPRASILLELLEIITHNKHI